MVYPEIGLSRNAFPPHAALPTRREALVFVVYSVVLPQRRVPRYGQDCVRYGECSMTGGKRSSILCVQQQYFPLLFLAPATVAPCVLSLFVACPGPGGR